MNIALQLLTITSSVILGGCDYYEAQRLISQTEKDLDVSFSTKPKLLKAESYGWAEEGGDRALFQLSAADCLHITKRLEVEVPITSTESSRMFQAVGIAPGRVRQQFAMTEHGDTPEYELDETSCVLFRQVHFE